MSTKKIKAVLFASLIAAVLIPAMFGSADAATTYTREQVDRAFLNAGDNVTFNDRNKMKLDRAAMIESGMSSDDVKIVKQYAKLHNALIRAMINGDEASVTAAKANLYHGKFALVFNDPAATRQASSQGGVSGMGFLDSSACGITNGVIFTYSPTPTLYIGTDGHADQSAIETWLNNNGQHIVNWPYADWGDLVYAEKNSTGQGGCTNGEFRDEWHVYDDSRNRTVGGVTSSGWHTLNHDNEPNPEVFDYSPPTYWWIGFVVYWHDNF